MSPQPVSPQCFRVTNCYTNGKTVGGRRTSAEWDRYSANAEILLRTFRCNGTSTSRRFTQMEERLTAGPQMCTLSSGPAVVLPATSNTITLVHRRSIKSFAAALMTCSGWSTLSASVPVAARLGNKVCRVDRSNDNVVSW